MWPGNCDPSERWKAAARRGRGRSTGLAARRHEPAWCGSSGMSAAVDTAPANAAPAADTRDARAAWALTAPALMLFIGVLVIPLGMTVMLSFHDWGQYKGIEPVFILKNWH